MVYFTGAALAAIAGTAAAANIERFATIKRSVTKTLPSGWTYTGCMVDNGNRILVSANQVSASNTPQTCIAFCSGKGYVYAGVEYAQECWCGNAYNPVAGTVQAAAESDCSSACTGDATQTCGAGNRIQVYHSSGATSSSTSTSTTATPSATATGKRGLAWPSDNNFDPAIFKSNQVTWLYNWGQTNTAKNKNFEFYAMQWSAAGASSLATNAASSGATHILGYNEPDNSGQSNMSPSDAATNWKTYIQPLAAKGYKLISPAVTNAGAPGGIAWLDSFIAACTGCQIDGIAIHWYGGWIDDFTSFVESAKKYNKPIYLTEFGFSWDADATVDSFTQFLPLAFSYLDTEPLVAKYAFFGAFYSGTAKDMIAANGTLTTLGKMYIS